MEVAASACHSGGKKAVKRRLTATKNARVWRVFLISVKALCCRSKTMTNTQLGQASKASKIIGSGWTEPY